MDGAFYNDLKEPHIAADQTSVTLATTDKALYPASAFPVLGSRYFDRVGKKIAINLFGRITTAATPGNGTFDVYWGTGADANGTIVASGPTNALTASQANMSWCLQLVVTCRVTGASGALLVAGFALFNEAVAAPHQLVPATAPAQVTVDLTAASILSVQFKRSGSTAETMQVHDIEVIALN